MTISEASAIIDRVRNENGFGLLEILEIMTDERDAGYDYWIQTYTLQERQAYSVLMAGFDKFFNGER